jgi:GNAT superfamily N-acetyltransferase
MNIIELKETDWEEIYPLSVQLNPRSKIDKDILKDCLKIMLADEHYLFFGLSNGEKLIGYISGFIHTMIYTNGRVACIDEIVIDQDFRREGYGKALISEFEERARQRGVKFVAVSTREVPGFYERIGYQYVGIYFKKDFRHFDNSPQDEIG